MASDYDALAARLAEAERLLRLIAEWGKDYDGAWNTLDRIDDFLKTADSAEACRHDWVTDGIGPTACCKCGVASTVNEVPK
jgi:hypothetical protein